MKPIASFLDKLLKDLGIEVKVKETQALIYWPEVVGERISQVTEAKEVKGGKLFIKVKGDSWRNELVYYKGDIISRINDKIGKGVIEDIIFF